MNEQPHHIIAGLQPYGDRFVEHVPELVAALPSMLELEPSVLDYSPSSVGALDQSIDRIGREACLRPRLFCALVAYVGEILIRNANARWEMSRHSDGTWEPWVVNENDRRGPFIRVFDRVNPDEDPTILEVAVGTDLLFLETIRD